MHSRDGSRREEAAYRAWWFKTTMRLEWRPPPPDCPRRRGAGPAPTRPTTTGRSCSAKSSITMPLISSLLIIRTSRTGSISRRRRRRRRRSLVFLRRRYRPSPPSDCRPPLQCSRRRRFPSSNHIPMASVQSVAGPAVWAATSAALLLPPLAATSISAITAPIAAKKVRSTWCDVDAPPNDTRWSCRKPSAMSSSSRITWNGPTSMTRYWMCVHILGAYLPLPSDGARTLV